MARPPPGTPPAEVALDEGGVRALLVAQHPDLAERPLSRVAEGWDNATWRLGRDLAVRLPRREVAVGLTLRELRHLPQLAARLPVATPVPVRAGAPCAGFPWPWLVVRWVEGVPAAHEPLSSAAAAPLGRALRALHAPAPEGAPANPFRGVPLRVREASWAVRRASVAGTEAARALDLDALDAAWRSALQAPEHTEPVWLHGDLHPRNTIGRGGALAGIIDWGDLCAGDRATDLAAAWMLLPLEAHGAFWEAYGTPSAAVWTRARAWAAALGMVLLDTGLADDPVFARIGTRTLERVAASASPP